MRIGRGGQITTAEGRSLGRIQLVEVPAPDGLIAAGDNLFLPSAASGAIRSADGALVQGTLEQSNVRRRICSQSAAGACLARP